MGTKTFKFSWLLEALSLQSLSWLQEQIFLLDYKIIGPLFHLLTFNSKDLAFFLIYKQKLCVTF